MLYNALRNANWQNHADSRRRRANNRMNRSDNALVGLLASQLIARLSLDVLSHGFLVLLMNLPLSKSQQRLRGRKVADMANDELRDWIDACDKMERSGLAAKARRSWKESGNDARNELERRNEPA